MRLLLTIKRGGYTQGSVVSCLALTSSHSIGVGFRRSTTATYCYCLFESSWDCKMHRKLPHRLPRSSLLMFMCSCMFRKEIFVYCVEAKTSLRKDEPCARLKISSSEPCCHEPANCADCRITLSTSLPSVSVYATGLIVAGGTYPPIDPQPVPILVFC